MESSDRNLLTPLSEVCLIKLNFTKLIARQFFFCKDLL
jgi:hypothetical protein